MSKKNRLKNRYNKWGYIFAIPFVVLFLVFHMWPLLSTIAYAFCDMRRFECVPRFLPSIGEPWYRNFQQVFESKSYNDAFRNTWIFFIAQVIPEWCIAFWLAAMVTDRRMKMKGRLVFKTAFFLPKLFQGSALGGVLLGHIIATATTVVMYVTMAAALDGFGVDLQDIKFFMSVGFLTVVASVFIHFGITFIYAVAGITSIPVELFEAAEMDGANRVQTFFRVTLPCMKPMMFFIAVVTLVEGLGMSDVPAAFGAFDSLRRNLTMMMYIQNQAFMGTYIFDRASAASLILLLMCGFFAVIIYLLFMKDWDEAKLKRLQKKELKAMENA